MATLLRRLGRDHTGQPTPARLAAVAQLALCVRGLEADGPMAGHLYDVLVMAPGDTTPTAVTASANSDHLAVLLQVAASACDVLAADAGARDALAQLLGLVLRPDLAVQAIPELVGLLKSGALVDVIALVGDLLHACGADRKSTRLNSSH